MSPYIVLFVILCAFNQIQSQKVRHCESPYILDGSVIEPSCSSDNEDWCTVKRGTTAQLRITFTPDTEVKELYVHAYVRKFWIFTYRLPLPTPDACSYPGMKCPLKANQTYTWNMNLPVDNYGLPIYSGDVIVALSKSNERAKFEKNEDDLVCFVISAWLVDE